jgi:hypothetical protein
VTRENDRSRLMNPCQQAVLRRRMTLENYSYAKLMMSDAQETAFMCVISFHWIIEILKSIRRDPVPQCDLCSSLGFSVLC